MDPARLRATALLLLGIGGCSAASRSAVLPERKRPVAADRNETAARVGTPRNDRDADGVPDRTDLCPADAEDQDAYEDQDGCPEPDNDLDKVPDILDKCPNEVETYNGFLDDDGCPDMEHAVRGRVFPKVYFDPARSEIKPAFRVVLDEMARSFTRELEPFEIVEVHAYELESEPNPLQLAALRAAAVRAYLIERRVDGSRLVTAAAASGFSCHRDAPTCLPWVEFNIVHRR